MAIAYLEAGRDNDKKTKKKKKKNHQKTKKYYCSQSLGVTTRRYRQQVVQNQDNFFIRVKHIVEKYNLPTPDEMNQL